MKSFFLKMICLTMILCMSATNVAYAAFISNDDVLSAQQSRSEIQALIDNDAVYDQLTAMGISPLEAKARIAALSDEQILQLKGKLSEIPAGEGAFGAVIGAILIVFLVLLFTDIIGETDVYDFDD